VTFNDHEGSTKSYAHTREHMHEVIETDFVPLRMEIKTDYAEGTVRAVTMHDGTVVKLRKVDDKYDASDRRAVLDYLGDVRARGEIATGLLYLEEGGEDMHGFENTVDTPLANIPYETLCPGSAALKALQKEWV
jgi:2-oxoglutarate ferredoxin oxidoreductase subunit beta